MDSWAIATYWFVSVAAIAYIIFYIVITIGGFFDLVYLFKSLKSEIVDDADDGRARVIVKEGSDDSKTQNEKAVL